AKGKQVNRSGVRIIESIEQRIAKRLGHDKLETLRELLAADWD
ncbi:MAG: MarR family transcriptional regulator, partial [Limnobacter sp.]|nr:MarR family transcriptional regulator [Limnobacter sp.]